MELVTNDLYPRCGSMRGRVSTMAFAFDVGFRLVGMVTKSGWPSFSTSQNTKPPFSVHAMGSSVVA